MTTSFNSVDLHPALLEAIDEMGFVEMTPIQAEALPLMLEGGDLRGQAKTGSGKTAAFGLAVLQALDTSSRSTQGLVLVPTRELAEQVAAELRRLARSLSNTRVTVVVGGRPYRDQVKALEAGAHVVVGTPGRVGKHLRKETLELSGLTTLVLDEADRMLEMGFIDQVMEIVEECPRERQTLLFSATFPEGVERLSRGVQRQPREVKVESQVERTQLRQLVHLCERGERVETLVRILAEHRPSQALIFCELRKECDGVVKQLRNRGASARALHGEMEQRDRDKVLQQFANDSLSVVVATNVAARGLDIEALPMVVNNQLPRDPESYLHRVGRTGRAGEEGLAVSLVAGRHEEARLVEIERFLGREIERGVAPLNSGKLGFLQPPNRTLLILGGRKEKLRAGDVVGALVKEAGVPGEAIGKIDLRERTCAVAVAREHAGKAQSFLKGGGRIKKRKYRSLLLD